MKSGKSKSGEASGAAPPERERVPTFGTVLDAERAEIRRRRAVWAASETVGEEAGVPAAAADPGTAAPPADLVGLALSGGGIRSATFSLGLLQEMSRLGVLKLFDYVSTVSGGGYTGGWWSAWLSRKGREPRRIFPPSERTEPERWPEYIAAGRADGEATPDASLSASRHDPIHHLRLFANYLTPRKGLLSMDTWRGVTVISRNLVLTWLVLLPILLAAVVAGQTYFTVAVDPEANFLRDFSVAAGSPAAVQARVAPPADAVADEAALAVQIEVAREQAEDAARQERLGAIRERAAAGARPLIVLLVWMVLLTLVWVVHGSGSGPYLFLATLGGTAAALFIGWTLYGALDDSPGGWPLPRGWTYLLVAGSVILIFACRALPTYLLMPRPGGLSRATVMPADLLRNRVVHAHERMLMTTVLLTVILLVSGFSHDLLWFLFDPASGGPLPSWVKQTGGWGAALATVGSMIFTGLKAAPAGGSGEGHGQPGRVSRVLFAVTPILAILLLAILSATAGRTLIRGLGDIATDMPRADVALLVAIALFLGFALFESSDAADGAGLLKKAGVPLIAMAAGAAFFILGPEPQNLTLGRVALWASVGGALVLGRWWSVLRGTAAAAGTEDSNATRVDDDDDGAARRHTAIVTALCLLALVGGMGLLLSDADIAAAPHFVFRGQDWAELAFTGAPGSFSLLLLAVALAIGVFAVGEQLVAPSGRLRAAGLLTVALVALCVRAAIPFVPTDAGRVAYTSAAITIVVLSIAWVVGLGWMANPNMLSLHAFYKARLVRAYLGASNTGRRSEEITASAVGDDVPLQDLANCDRGAPYPLINTTLNLVGGRDLSTAQRSADAFLLSKHYCGSARTGFRPTAEYMGGRLTLGTAVAVSGAAASPNMGSLTPPAALSMLLALLNVRLGFWAPTPNQPLWRDSRPRLWPFYLLREFLSQTDDLAPYCSLSDGGHFDNSGLYALVARGCRYVVFSDCGADPLPCFEDIGNAIRRCRIDFGAEIDLQIDPFLRSDGKPPSTHFAVGTVTYSAAHARALGWSDWASADARRGVVVWIKPGLTLTTESADLRQYGLENPVFPQQSTTDQWYDEAQFESYRRLGEFTARQVFGGANVPGSAAPGPTGEFFENLRAPEPKRPPHLEIDVVSVDGHDTLRIVETADR
ncbi:MAG: patatin-like phospholipase family protein [Gemmatimonadota bacterium]